MELLAPAGSVEHFSVALEAGADAVYVGAPFLNARNPSRELRFEEIRAMAEHARSRQRRLYVALNSLVREDDRKRLIQTLAYLETINPHALIVQDLGVIELIRRYFNTLRMHASTLMFAHSSNDVELLTRLGCARVVLARELTLEEIGAIVRTSPVEIEVFVHGAMCFSYSGRCLFSSFHGGKSGLRGNCVQPCRRKFTVGSGAASRGGKTGYVFSMNDLEGIEFARDFRKMGVASIKIEGRLKPVTYVQHVVRAYRTVLDADSDHRHEAMDEARKLLEASLGRRRSGGYFLSPNPKDVIVSSHSGNIGTHLGAASRFTREAGNLWVVLNVKAHCREGDRLRLHFDKSGERTAFTARKIERLGDGRTKVLLPDTVGENKLRGKIDVYRVDTTEKMLSASTVAVDSPSIEPFSSRELDRVQKKCAHVGRLGYPPAGRRPARPEADRNPSAQAELWVRFDSAKPIYQKLPFAADRFVIPVDKRTLSETGHLSRYFGKNRNRVIWALPPVVYTQRSTSLERDIQVLIRTGFRSFQISTLGQLMLFHEKNISLFADFTLNVLNSTSMFVLAELGFKGVQFSIETDREALKAALNGYRLQQVSAEAGRIGSRRPRKGMVGLTVYGSPPLFMSRVHPQHVSFKQSITSPKQERFVVHKAGAETFTRPVMPFSLLPYRKELEKMGLDYLVIDLSGIATGKRELQEIAKRIEGKERVRKLSTFNFEGILE